MIAANDIYKAPADVWARLAAPLTDGSISWRQDGKPIVRDGRFLARFVAYVEANTVRERLDTIVPGEWDLTLTPLPQIQSEPAGEATVAFKARLQVLGVVREDVGTGRDYKQAATDAFKRAAVRFGIAHELYSYGQNWVELDGDGRHAKPVEDPSLVYARRNPAPTRTASAVENKVVVSESAESSHSPAPVPARALDEESCPQCGGRMWDNRLTKRNPRAPDFKCRDRSCDGVIWPAREGAQSRNADAADAPVKAEASMPWAPLPGAPLIPEDAELPF
ncbi:MAG TPA: Rad52/Rad22 family DNA repair protein [Gemmatimonadaceae bacterium]|nr:Rad52/Rad22 family DNA repair protein [Gemmatimonadaceae bacterium]